MRVNRRFLYPGLFLVALGGVLMTTQLVPIPAATITEALRLWPFAFIAIGAGIALRRSGISLGAGMLGAAVPGLVLGGALAVVPRFADGCTVPGREPASDSRGGTLSGPGHISIHASCGALTIATGGGSAWRLDSTDTSGRAPRIEAAGNLLSIRAVGTATDEDPPAEQGRDTWVLTVPTAQMEALSVELDAGQGDVRLGGARVGLLSLNATASDVAVDATGAILNALTGQIRFTSATILLPSGSNLEGHLTVSASELRLCTPPDLGLRVTTRASGSAVTIDGLHQAGAIYESVNYATATHHAELALTASFSDVEINPIGGCS